MPNDLPRLFINHIPSLDWLIALEYGRVDEGQPDDCWSEATEDFEYLHDAPGGRSVGFRILGYSRFDLESDEASTVWNPPLFAAPTLGLASASAGEIATVARAKLGFEPTLNRLYFNEAIDAESEEDEIAVWWFCLETGDCMAHYGIGIALLEAGRPAEAYDHLRYYAQIAPASAWAHHWHGRAALAIGEISEARGALERSLKFEDDSEPMNHSRVLLVKLDGS